MYNTKLRSVRSKETGNEPKSATKRKRGRPRKKDICDTSIDHHDDDINDHDPTWCQDNTGNLRQSKKENRLRLVAKTKSGRLPLEDTAHEVPTRSQNKRKELGRRTTSLTLRNKNNQAILHDSDEKTEPHLIDNVEDPPRDCDTTVQAKNNNLLERFKEIPSPQRPKHQRTQIFKCEDCNAHFLKIDALETHIYRKRHDTELVTCDKCNFKFVLPTLRKHMKLHHHRLELSRENFEVLTMHEIKKLSRNKKERVRLFKCNECDAHYTRRNSLRNHVQRQCHNDNNLVLCKICDLKFHPRTLTQHIKIHHDRMGLHREDFDIVEWRSPCIYSYFTRKGQEHTSGGNSDGLDQTDNNRRENKNASMTIDENKEAIPRAYLFKCEDCDTHYLSQCSLLAHVRRKRHDNELFPCDICKIKFPIITLNRHMEIHHHSLGLRRENFEIVVGLHLSDKANKITEKHQDNTSEGDSDSNQIDLKNVQSKATAVGQNLTTRCPKKYLLKENLLYKCVVCGLHFLKEKSLLEHIRLKCGIKPHGARARRCPVCKLIFSNVTGHIVLHHKKQKLSLKDLKVITMGNNRTFNTTQHTTGAISRTLKLQFDQQAPGILYQCRGCRNHFVWEQTATVHQNVCSPSDETCGVPCHDCGRTFYKDELILHRTRDHKNVRAKFDIVKISRAQLFKCEHCEMHFMQRMSLVTHGKRNPKHINTGLFECNICKIKFSFVSLEKHLEVHHDRLRLRAEDIDVFVGLNAVPVPIRAKERDQMSASSIDSSDEISLEDAGTRQLNTTSKHPTHAKRRSLLKKVMLYKCKHCDMHFLNTYEVYQHMKTCNHLSSTAAVCSVCKLSFFHHSLSKHFRRHHEVQKLARKDFMITTCGKRKCLDEKVQHNQLENNAKETKARNQNKQIKETRNRKTKVIENAMLKNIDQSKEQHNQLENKTKELRTRNQNKQRKETPIATPELNQRNTEVTYKYSNREQDSINTGIKDLQNSVQSKGSNTLSAFHNVEASISNSMYHDTALNDICVPKHMRCHVIIEKAMINNINRYVKRRTLRSNVNKTSEPVNPSLEDGNRMIPNNGVRDSLTVGYSYGGLCIKTESNDEDIALNRFDNGYENAEKYNGRFDVKNEVVHDEEETGVPDEYHPEIKDGIDDIKYEVEDVDGSGNYEIDISDNNVPAVEVFKVERSDSVLVSVVPNFQDTFDSTSAENNDVFVKIKDVFSLAPLETENDATSIEN